jgi:hypothetical protein
MVCENWKNVSTNSPTRARLFVEDLLAGRLGHEQANNAGSGKRCEVYERLLHVLPQVAFVVGALARHDVASLDYIGRLETLDSDWEELGRHVATSVPEVERDNAAWPRFNANLWSVPWAPRRTADPHAQTNQGANSSAREDMNSLISEVGNAARISLCRIFLPDYVCFGFALPEDCAAAIGSHHGVACPWPWSTPAYLWKKSEIQETVTDTINIKI